MPSALSPAWRRRIEVAYAEPHRRYHTMAHLNHMFAEAARFAPLTPELEYAIWFHDFIYDPRSATNEEDSAGIAAAALAEMGEPASVIARTEELIRSTRHGALSTAARKPDAERDLLLCLDLAILAAAPAHYDAYAAQVQAEFAHVPDAAFVAGRAAFMRKFLELPLLFPHPAFADYEAPARANINRELLLLIRQPT